MTTGVPIDPGPGPGPGGKCKLETFVVMLEMFPFILYFR